MKTLFAFIFAVIFSLGAQAQNVKRLFQDIKLPTQAQLEHQTIAIPVVASATRLKTGQATSASVTTTVTSFSAQPDVPRIITITPTGTTADVPAGDVVITGTNILDKVITESITIAANASTLQSGVKAFKSVTSVLFPIQDGAGATYNIGVGSALGVKRCAANAGAYSWSVFDGAFETTRGTLVADADEVEKNVFTPNGTMNGAKNVELYFVQNWACYP